MDKKYQAILFCLGLVLLVFLVWKFFPVSVKKINFGQKFQISYIDSKQPRFERYKKLFATSSVAEGITKAINRFSIDKPFKLVFGECGKQDFYFDEQKREIRACYEMVDALGSAYTSDIRDVNEYDRAIVNSTYYLVLHNIAHAVGNLPATGSDSIADEIAASIALSCGNQCSENIFTGGLYFISKGDEKKMEQLSFSDERSTNLSRFINYACLAYGQNPKDKNWLIENKVIPENEALKCGQNYANLTEKYKNVFVEGQ